MYQDLPKEIQSIVEHVIAVEGGYVDNPADPGGKTKYGITEKVARANGYDGEIKDLHVEFAREIYVSSYVLDPKFDLVLAETNVELAEELIDSGINVGWRRAATWLQRALNALNLRATIYPDLVEDGMLGPKTISALRAYVAYRGTAGIDVLVKACNSLQCVHYIDISQSNEKLEDFVYGWITNRV